MKFQLEKYKGIHPGTFLEHELKKRKLSKSRFALSVMEYPQTFVAITKGKRKLNLSLALKIEKELNLEEGSLMIMQLFYDIQQHHQEQNTHRKPNLSKIRRILFWDTDFDQIDWELQFESIVKRVFERGNEEEKNEMYAFYGRDKVEHVLKI